MGAIHNFNIKGFYGIERPEPEPIIEEEEEVEDDNQDRYGWCSEEYECQDD
jgi:hypothetical protein